MNSGLRLTVALLLVAFISIGFYFASLEDADRSEEASITRDPVSEVDTDFNPSTGFPRTNAGLATRTMASILPEGRSGWSGAAWHLAVMAPSTATAYSIPGL